MDNGTGFQEEDPSAFTNNEVQPDDPSFYEDDPNFYPEDYQYVEDPAMYATEYEEAGTFTSRYFDCVYIVCKIRYRLNLWGKKSKKKNIFNLKA